MVLTALFVLALRPAVGWPKVGARLGIGLVGAAGFFVPFAVFWKAPLLVAVPCSVAIYALVLALFRETRHGELSTLLRILSGRST